MKPILVFLIIVFTQSVISVSAQTLQRDSLVASWICVEATIPENVNLPKDELEGLKMMQAGVLKSIFHFNKTVFQWDFPADSNPVFQQLTFLNGRPWSIQPGKDLIHIDDPSENLMQIMVLRRNNAIYFVLSDTPLLLRMEKLGTEKN